MTKKNFSNKEPLLRKYSPKYYDREDCESTSHEDLDWDIDNPDSVEMEEDYSMQVVAHMPDLNGETSETAPRHLSRFDKQRNFQFPNISLEKVPVKKCAVGLAVIFVFGLIIWSFIPKSQNSEQAATFPEEPKVTIFNQNPVEKPEARISAETALDSTSGMFQNTSAPSEPQHSFEMSTFGNFSGVETHRSQEMPNQNFQPQSFASAPVESSPWDKPATSSDHNYMFYQSQQAASTSQQPAIPTQSFQSNEISYQQNNQASWSAPVNPSPAASFPPQTQQYPAMTDTQGPPMYYSNVQTSIIPQNVQAYPSGESTVPGYYQPAPVASVTQPAMPQPQNMPIQGYPQMNSMPQDQVGYYAPSQSQVQSQPQIQVPNVAMASHYTPNFDNLGNQQQPVAPQGSWPQQSYPQTLPNTLTQNNNLNPQPATQNFANTPYLPHPQSNLAQIPAGPARSYKDTDTGYGNNTAIANGNTNGYLQSQQPLMPQEYPALPQPYPVTMPQTQTTNHQQPQHYIR